MFRALVDGMASAGCYKGPMTQFLSSAAFPAPEHDHGHCLAEAMQRARKAFEDKGLKLTCLRRSVFAEIAASHKAIGAYEVLARLAARGERLAPISVYRAIDALVAVGIVHRFESRNAFFACHAGHAARRQLVLACESCRSVAEVDGDGVFQAIDRAADLAAFSAKEAVVEVWGLCANCAGAAQEAEHGRA
jgi:Fur family transcriptional regulator, zinc uptake regulator